MVVSPRSLPLADKRGFFTCVVDKCGDNLDILHKCCLLVALFDIDLLPFSNILEQNLHHCVSSSAIQSIIHGFTEVLNTLIHQQ
jgi:hypothetical protein